MMNKSTDATRRWKSSGMLLACKDWLMTVRRVHGVTLERYATSETQVAHDGQLSAGAVPTTSQPCSWQHASGVKRLVANCWCHQEDSPPAGVPASRTHGRHTGARTLACRSYQCSMRIYIACRYSTTALLAAADISTRLRIPVRYRLADEARAKRLGLRYVGSVRSIFIDSSVATSFAMLTSFGVQHFPECVGAIPKRSNVHQWAVVVIDAGKFVQCKRCLRV
jgi:hypothetical protein